MYDLVYVAHPFGGEHNGYDFYASVWDVTTSMQGTQVGEVQGRPDQGSWVNFKWPKILQDNHKYIIAVFAMHTPMCVVGDINNGSAGPGNGQWIFPVPAPGDAGPGSGFPAMGPAPVTQGYGGGMSTGVITAAIVKASEMGDNPPGDGSYYMYRFSSNPAPHRAASCMYFPGSMGSATLLPACGAGTCHP
jgi:hypothetical protein